MFTSSVVKAPGGVISASMWAFCCCCCHEFNNLVTWVLHLQGEVHEGRSIRSVLGQIACACTDYCGKAEVMEWFAAISDHVPGTS